MITIAGMASNRGRNLLNLDDRRPGGARVEVVVSNIADAPILAAAADRGIETVTVERAVGESRTDHESRIVDALDPFDVELVCLDGYMRILTDEFLDAMPTTLNVHPSLLPSFPGTDAWGQALDAGVSLSGCTVHVVTETVDGGPIVTQEPIPVYPTDDVQSLKERILYRGEFVAYPRAVEAFSTDRVRIDHDSNRVEIETDGDGPFPQRRLVSSDLIAMLRYGENPHQSAVVYRDGANDEPASIVTATQRNPNAKALSYNNYNDADAALELIKEFDEPAAAVIKHANPAGCASAKTIDEAYDRALSTDPMSAFGGIVALNRPCDRVTASAIVDSFKEVVVAPSFDDDALAVLRERENIRLLEVGRFDPHDPDQPAFAEKPLVGGRLVQERDRQRLHPDDLTVVTTREPTTEQRRTMVFAWQTVKHVKSNAIVLATDTETVGIGMGQVSRVDAVRLATLKAAEHAEGKDATGSVMASDAFFPFPDGIEVAADAGVAAVIQPGGSVNDDEVVATADRLGIAMVHTGQRCFRHD